MKTKKELTALKEEAETLNGTLRELTEEELAQVSGGKKDNPVYYNEGEYRCSLCNEIVTLQNDGKFYCPTHGSLLALPFPTMFY